MSDFEIHYLWFSNTYLKRKPHVHYINNKSIKTYPTTKIYVDTNGTEYFVTHVSKTMESKPLFLDTILLNKINAKWLRKGDEYHN